MTQGHRVSRSTLKSAKAVRKLFPWASRLVRVDGVWVAYEDESDALEEHGSPHVTRCDGVSLPWVGSTHNIARSSPIGGLVWQAKRRGDL